MLVSCDTQPPINSDDAIKLAKAAAAELHSPPRTYYLYLYVEGHNASSFLKSWPDEPSSRADAYNVCGAATGSYSLASTSVLGEANSSFRLIGNSCSAPITFTTVVTPAGGGSEVDVAFVSSWLERETFGQTEVHRWLFHISSDRKVAFIREEGDKLPDVPQ